MGNICARMYLCIPVLCLWEAGAAAAYLAAPAAPLVVSGPDILDLL